MTVASTVGTATDGDCSNCSVAAAACVGIIGPSPAGSSTSCSNVLDDAEFDLVLAHLGVPETI